MHDTKSMELEQLVDSVGLVAVLQILSSICAEKVSHLSENWQDATSDQFKTWKHNASYLDKVSNTVWRQQWERL